jgi:hypothetical protein
VRAQTGGNLISLWYQCTQSHQHLFLINRGRISTGERIPTLDSQKSSNIEWPIPYEYCIVCVVGLRRRAVTLVERPTRTTGIYYHTYLGFCSRILY